MARTQTETENFKFFQNKDCEYFPCHETKDIENFNCIFCYCPLYALGKDCGGGFEYTDKGIKNCEKCTFPHRRANYDQVIEKVRMLIEKVRDDTMCKEKTDE